MKPIAQTFIINEPESGVEAVFLKQIDLYFQSKSDTFGVEVQIRETVNGYPTQRMVPYGKAAVSSVSVETSTDASIPSSFFFNTPVLLKTNEQYAIVVIPMGGNPDYNIWVGSIGDEDVTTNTPIFNNNQTGSLFISSNDLNFTPIQNESMKYKLYTAQFNSRSATAVFKNTSTDFMTVTDVVGNFAVNEQVVVANNGLELAALSISGSNTFTAGEIVFQPNTAASYQVANAYGTVYFANTSKVLLRNIVGKFEGTNTLKGATSGALVSAPTLFYQNVITTAACNQVVVPDANTTLTTDFAVNNMIYIGTGERANVQVLKITSVSEPTRTLTLDANVAFTDNNAIIGRVKADASLFGTLSSMTRTTPYRTFTIRGVTSNTSQNFSGSSDKLLIGRSSGATANIVSVFDMRYESITPQLGIIEPNKTSSSLYFGGTSNTKAFDTVAHSLVNQVPYEFTDKQRIIMSRSNEYSAPLAGGAGTKSLVFTAYMNTNDTQISPYIDRINLNAAYTHNILVEESMLSGYKIAIANSSASFQVGETVFQSNATVNTFGTVAFSNSTLTIVSNIASDSTTRFGIMNANGTSIITGVDSGAIANVTGITSYAETGNNVLTSCSRYISKNVILAEGQDAEDVVAYITAYRPAGTNFKVYAKLLAAADQDKFTQKDWSAMVETSSPALLSSAVDRSDYVELVYNLPVSEQVITNSASVNTSSAAITMSSTARFTAGSFIYFVDSGAMGRMNVRRVMAVTNSTHLQLSSTPTFVSSNCAVGLIPGLESEDGAFRYANNNSICRYTSAGDAVFDSFKTFAIKIVPVSENPAIAPRMADFRALALQI